MADLFDMDPLFFVDVDADLLFVEALPESQELNHIFGSLFEHDQTIDIPRIESESTIAIEDELGEKLEYYDHDLVIIMKGIQSTLHDRTKVLRV